MSLRTCPLPKRRARGTACHASQACRIQVQAESGLHCARRPREFSPLQLGRARDHHCGLMAVTVPCLFKVSTFSGYAECIVVKSRRITGGMRHA